MPNPDDSALSAFDALAEPELYDQVIQLRQKVQEKRIRCNRVLQPEEITAFEEKHKIMLPAGYQFYLRYIGDGMTMNTEFGKLVVSPLVAGKPEKNIKITGDIHEPFPYTQAQEDEFSYEEGPDLDSLEAEWAKGTLAISQEEQRSHWLVVTGEKAGTVWESRIYYFSHDAGDASIESWGTFLEWLEYHVRFTK